MEKNIEYKMVDLGLPSGLKWADRNVGAVNVQDYGDYFMWGSTTPETNKPCDWAHAPFNGGSSEFDKEYFKANSGTWLTEDGTLKPEYDAAHAVMGGSWRMPTSVEMEELLDGTNHKTGTMEGVKGMFFISKIDAAKSIFMPFGGYSYDSDVNGACGLGNVWSSSLSVGNAYSSHGLYFYNDGYASTYFSSRYLGFAVRGVHE